MGICHSSSYIKEKELNEHPKSLDKDDFKKILQQMEESVCKIKCINGSFGTGFVKSLFLIM